MMNIDELKIWFWNLYNSCYVVKHDDYPKVDFLYYDVNFARTIKMSQILKKDIVYVNKPVGKCLFCCDWKFKKLWIDYAEIWTVFEKELSYNYHEIEILISTFLMEYDKLKVLTPKYINLTQHSLLTQHVKLKILI